MHCQRTHYYPAQPDPQKPRHLDVSICDNYRPGFHEETADHFSATIWSYVSMRFLITDHLITQGDLSKPVKSLWMFVFNVVPEVFQDPKETFSIFLLGWKRALKAAKAAPVCLT